MNFEEFELNPSLLNAVKECDYTKPTSVQKEAIPAALEGKDLLIASPTGTGKTVAYLLPALQHLLDFPRRHPGSGRVLILTPTRELAQQVAVQAQSLARFAKLKTLLITGGVSYEIHDKALSSNIDVVVATPGRLMEYIDDERFDCQDVEILILDEADRMLDMGFIQQMQRISDETHSRKQTTLLSATLEGNILREFSREVQNVPVSIAITPPRSESAKIQQWLHIADDIKHKKALLKSILEQNQESRVMVFVNTRERLMMLLAYLNSELLECTYLRGEMPQAQRAQALKSFKTGKTRLMLATDVAARGLDVDEISHVINFDIPRKADVYIHRIGRTGRAGNKGTAISLAEAHEMGSVARIERYSEQRLKRRAIKGLEPQHKEARPPTKNKKAKVKLSKSKKAVKKRNKKAKNK